MSKRRVFLISIIALLSGGLLLTSCHHRSRFCSENFPDKILKHMDRQVAKLELNAVQQQHYDGLREEIRQDLVKMRDERIKSMDELTEELNKEKPDMDYIVTTAKKRHEKMTPLFDRYSERFLQFYKILDEKQQKQVVEKMKDLADRFNCN